MATLRRCAIAGLLLMAPLALMVPLPASAQSSDAQYCTELGHLYTKYVTSTEGKRPRPPTPDISAAMTKCQSDPASSIPVLEKALTDAKVNLPNRG